MIEIVSQIMNYESQWEVLLAGAPISDQIYGQMVIMRDLLSCACGDFSN